MARESTTRVGSGIQVFRETASPPLVGMMGGNSTLINYEDVNSMLGVVQSSGLIVSTLTPVHLTGPATRLRGRRKVFIQNRGPNTAYIGASNVTTSNGYGIPHSGSMELDVLDFGHIMICSEGVSNIRILEMR